MTNKEKLIEIKENIPRVYQTGYDKGDVAGYNRGVAEIPEVEETVVVLSMADGDQVISPSEDKLLSKVTVTKPSTMLPENIKEGVEIGGVVGTHVGGMTPTGEIEITENRTYDVTQYATAKVQVGEAGESINGYDIATMQKFLDSRDSMAKLTYLYAHINMSGTIPAKNEDLEWLTKVDLKNPRSTAYMFYSFKNADFTKPPLFDTSWVSSMSNMFGMGSIGARTPYLNIPDYDTGRVTDMSCMFKGRGLAKMPNFNTDSVTNASEMFSYVDFETGNTDIGVLNFNKATNLKSMFYSSNITSLAGLNAEVCSSFAEFFNGCVQLISVGDIYSSKSDCNLNGMFKNCYGLKSVGALPQATNCNYMFQSCTSLEVAPNLDISKLSGLYYTFNGCTALKTVNLDVRNIQSFSNVFNQCSSLSQLTLKNIKEVVQVGSGTSWGHLLTVGSLIGLCYECRDTGYSKKLTVGTSNLEKLANVYVKTIDITDEMTAADDLVSAKLPFEAYVIDPDNTADITSHVTTTRVSSVDELPEGAVLMSDYVVLKHWQLA